jgi:hypothetical protein
MINLLKEATDAATSGGGLLTLLAIVLGGTGFWKLIEIIFQSKREDKKENTVTSKQFKEVSDDIKDIKHDLALLHQANDATVKYREMRDKKDQEAVKVQEGMIKAIRGIMRDRLLETYERCTAKGYYSREEREIYSRLYQCYREEPFNGNSVIVELHDRIVKLPLEKPE